MGSVWPPCEAPLIPCTSKGRFDMQDKIQAVLVFATKIQITERRRSLSPNFVELANECHGEHRALREAGDGTHCGREKEKLYPDRIGGEVGARGAGGVRG